MLKEEDLTKYVDYFGSDLRNLERYLSLFTENCEGIYKKNIYFLLNNN